MELLCFYKICNYICGACPSPCFSSLIYYKGIQVCDGDRYWVTVDGVRQLYRRIECKMCFEVIEKLKKI